jgi:hypothetical protein
MSKLTSFMPILLLLALGACASVQGEFPSLERRPYESNAPITEPESPATPLVLSPELAAKVDALLARHYAAQDSFARGLNAVQAVAQQASGSKAGSESWVNAHVQLSRLDKARADSVDVLRGFDVLVTTEGAVDARLATLLADAQMPVAAAVDAQNAEISRLSRLIGE